MLDLQNLPRNLGVAQSNLSSWLIPLIPLLIAHGHEGHLSWIIVQFSAVRHDSGSGRPDPCGATPVLHGAALWRLWTKNMRVFMYRRAVCMLNATSVYVPRRYSGWELRITNVGLSLRLTKFSSSEVSPSASISILLNLAKGYSPISIHPTD